MKKGLLWASAALLLLGAAGVLYFLVKTETPKPASATPNPAATDTLPQAPPRPDPRVLEYPDSSGKTARLELINPTFLNNETRNYYGDSAPSRLDILWKHNLGTGTTNVNGALVKWSGAGWTGQPLLVLENGRKFIIQGAYDHHLKKIDAETGKLVWQYGFDDVLKGTGTIWINHRAERPEERVVILQGSRAGLPIESKVVPSYRAVSYFTGKELWRLNSPPTRCYSRDVDASALIINDTAYIGLETGIWHVFNPDARAASVRDGILQPQIYRNIDTLYEAKDATLHGGNLVTEASPARLGERVYVASGSGWVWGYNLRTQTMDWSFFIGSDIDGSPVVTADSCLLISVEKQYIKGQGGLLKLDPRRDSANAVVWYFPTGDRKFASWLGGIIGTAGVNDAYRTASEPSLAAFVAIDGFTYVVDVLRTDSTRKATLFDGARQVPTPKLVFKYETGPSISTPIFVGNRLIVTGYDGTHLFEKNAQGQFVLLAKNGIRCEATPFAHQKRIYLASRDGSLYCLGEK